MDRVHTVKEKQFSQIVHVAVAIRAVDGGGRHTGILHRETQCPFGRPEKTGSPPNPLAAEEIIL